MIVCNVLIVILGIEFVFHEIVNIFILITVSVASLQVIGFIVVQLPQIWLYVNYIVVLVIILFLLFLLSSFIYLSMFFKNLLS